jgi:hypothetical protein
MQCEICGSDAICKSRLRSSDFVRLAFLLRPFRCVTCKHRFYRTLWTLVRPTPTPHANKAVQREPVAEPDLPIELDDRSNLMLYFDDSPESIGLDFVKGSDQRALVARDV